MAQSQLEQKLCQRRTWIPEYLLCDGGVAEPRSRAITDAFIAPLPSGGVSSRPRLSAHTIFTWASIALHEPAGAGARSPGGCRGLLCLFGRACTRGRVDVRIRCGERRGLGSGQGGSVLTVASERVCSPRGHLRCLRADPAALRALQASQSRRLRASTIGGARRGRKASRRENGRMSTREICASIKENEGHPAC